MAASRNASACRSIPISSARRAPLRDAAGSFAPFLLQGVTGSGKTEVYLAAAAACIAARRAGADPGAGDQPDAAVPAAHCATRFRASATVTLHSRLAAGERLRHWRAAATRRRRSRPRHPARGVRAAAAPRARSSSTRSTIRRSSSRTACAITAATSRSGARGSAASRWCSAARRRRSRSLVHAQRGRYRWLKLPQRAVAPARLPDVVLRAATATPRRVEGIGAPLVAALAARLARGEQSLVFINRRGFAPSLLCSACGWQAGCPRCSARLVVHREDGGSALPSLRARRAAAARRVPTAATSTSCRSGTARSGSSARSPSAFRRRASRASIATARGARAPSPACASACTRARSTSSSARRCSPRATISRASRWSACWAPTTRSTAAISARPSAWPRSCSRWPGAPGAPTCRAK